MSKELLNLIEDNKKRYEESQINNYIDMDFLTTEDYSFHPIESADYNGFMVFGSKKDVFKKSEVDKKFFVGNYAYKHRYFAYYDLRQNKEERFKNLTFLLFNPSFANPKKIDPTVKNCLDIAKMYAYTSVEVINLFSYRCAEVKSECSKNNSTNYDFIRDIIQDNSRQYYVKAWGDGKLNKKFCVKTIEDIETLFKNRADKQVFRLKVKDEVLESFKTRILHPAVSTWSTFGSFIDVAELR